MSTVEFKAACAAHRKCCPYKATGMTITPDGKCPTKDCYYMAKFKKVLKKLSEK